LVHVCVATPATTGPRRNFLRLGTEGPSKKFARGPKIRRTTPPPRSPERLRDRRMVFPKPERHGRRREEARGVVRPPQTRPTSQLRGLSATNTQRTGRLSPTDPQNWFVGSWDEQPAPLLDHPRSLPSRPTHTTPHTAPRAPPTRPPESAFCSPPARRLCSPFVVCVCVLSLTRRCGQGHRTHTQTKTESARTKGRTSCAKRGFG